MSCSICMDSFTSALRKRTDCSYCNVPICRACLQTCLLMDNAAEPVCPSCRAAWSREFLNENLTAAFRNGPFKKYREKVLVDRERARLPETQEQAAAYKTAVDALKPIDARITVLKERMDSLESNKTFTAARAAYYASRAGRTYSEWGLDPATRVLYKAMHVAAMAMERETKPLRKKMLDLRRRSRNDRSVRASFGTFVPTAAARAPAVEPPKHVFIQQCPATACEGFLTNKWVCGMCNTKVCKDCHEPKTDADAHMCDPELVQSIKAIRKEAKPCPKCAAQISKIDGCDQMWCTQCKTAFSWNTGKIETHIVHNPHYFQWMRENGGIVPRAPGDVPRNPCQNQHNVLAERLASLRSQSVDGVANTAVADTLLQFLRIFIHIQWFDIQQYRNAIQMIEHDEWRRRLRVQRMAQEITDDEWKTILQRREKEMTKDRERVQLLEMYSTAGMDILGQVLTSDALHEIEMQVTTLFEFTDKASKKMADVYKCVPLSINPALIQRHLGF